MNQHESQGETRAAPTVVQTAESVSHNMTPRQPRTEAERGQTLQTLVCALADHGERPAVVAFQKTACQPWSFTTLADHAQRLATGLLEAGLQPGAHVILFAPNGPEWILSCCALLAAGAVPVPVDAQSSEADLQHVWADSDARWIFTTATLATPVLQCIRSH